MSTSSFPSDDSIEKIDTISEDLSWNEEFRATGFKGNNSVLAWLYNLEPDSEHQFFTYRNIETAGRTQLGQHVSLLGLDSDIAFSYFLDDQKLPESNTINPYKLPSKNIAKRILHSYFKSVHPLFPIICIDLFLGQINGIWGVNGGQRPGQKWLAIFNMTLAIGCRRLQFMQEKLPPGVSHEVFFSRARSLSVNENMSFNTPTCNKYRLKRLWRYTSWFPCRLIGK